MNSALRNVATLTCRRAGAGLRSDLASSQRMGYMSFARQHGSPLMAKSIAVNPAVFHSSARAGWSRVAAVGLGAGFSLFGWNAFSGSPAISKVECDTSAIPPPPSRPQPGDTPRSIVNPYELSFGAVCGICAGVFVKKGARAIAFLLGGVFVLMQYLQSRSFISVNWSKASSTFDKAFGTSTSEGKINAPTVQSAWRWIVDFLTANFQQRATFLAGFALGIRIG